MSVFKQKSADGTVSWNAYISKESKELPGLRIQMRVGKLRTKADAVREEKKLIERVMTRMSNREGHGFTWRAILEKWYLEFARGENRWRKYERSTLLDYYQCMYHHTKEWLDKPAQLITKGDARLVLDRAYEAEFSQVTIRRIRNTINVIYNWAIEERLIRGVIHSPVHDLRIVVKDEKKQEILKLDEIRKLLFEAKHLKHEWYPIWAMALLTGMRNGELLALKWVDVDFDNAKITVHSSHCSKTREIKSTKAGHWRTVPISPELKQVLLELKESANGEFVLVRPYGWHRGGQARVLRTFCKHIGISNVRFHTLRASFATQLISNGAEPSKVMKICGWLDLKTMQRYIRVAGIDERGVTDGLRFLPHMEDHVGNVVNLFTRETI